MSKSRHSVRAISWIALVLYEVILLVHQYASRGTSWHYLVHSMIGAGLGLGIAAIIASVRHQPSNPWLWALFLQTISMLPDYIFIFTRMPHDQWMDVFVGHISIHTSPQPLLIALMIFIAGGWAWFVSSSLQKYRLGLILAATCFMLLAIDLSFHRALPTKLSDYSSFR